LKFNYFQSQVEGTQSTPRTKNSVAFAGVLLLGILKGVLLAAIATILMLLRRVAYPNVAFLGRIPDTRRFSDLARHPDNERIEGVLIFRIEASLLYFNADNVRQTVLNRIRTEGPVSLVVGDLSNSPYVDLTGARMLAKLSEDLAERGVVLRLAETHAEARDLLRAEDLEAKVGRIDRFTSVADVVDRFETNKHGVGPRVSWSNGGTDYIELASSSPKEKEGIGV
jgi:sulfate permease, SulP family